MTLDPMIEDHRAAVRRALGLDRLPARRGVASTGQRRSRGVSSKSGSAQQRTDRCAVFGRQTGLPENKKTRNLTASAEGSGKSTTPGSHNVGDRVPGMRHRDAETSVELAIFDGLPRPCREILRTAPFNYLPSGIRDQLLETPNVDAVVAFMRQTIRRHVGSAYRDRGFV